MTIEKILCIMTAFCVLLSLALIVTIAIIVIHELKIGDRK